jgi:hypothetical protein
MSARDTIVVSMPGADMVTLAAERVRLLGEVHPGTAVVVTRGMAPEPELRALCVRAETLLSAAAAAGMPCGYCCSPVPQDGTHPAVMCGRCSD